MNNPFTFGSELSKSQVDAALSKLTSLMMDEQIRKKEDIPKVPTKVTEPEEQPEIPKISIQQFNQLIGRIYDKHQMTQEKVQQQRDQERSKSPFKPKINENSQKIIQSKGDYQPIQKRAQQILNDKKQKQDEYQKLKSMHENEQSNFFNLKYYFFFTKESQYTFRPNINLDYEPRSVEQFLEQVEYFIQKKNQQIQLGQQEKLEKEMQGLTFKPKLNKNSEKIIQESKDLNTSVQERIQKTNYHKQQKEKKILQEQLRQTPFAPKINTKSQKLVSKSPNRKQHNYVNHSMFYGDKSYEDFQNRSQTPIKSSRTPIRSRSPLLQSKTPNRNQSPLSNNKRILNTQEIKFSPNLKFIADLIKK